MPRSKLKGAEEMKSTSRLFFISLLATSSLILFNCNTDHSKKDTQGETLNVKTDHSKKDTQGETLLSTVSNRVSFTVQGIVCDSCINTIKRTMLSMDGVLSVEADISAEDNVRVSFDPSKVTVEQLKKAIVDTGKEVTAHKMM